MEKIEIRKANLSDSPFISLLARITFTETFGSYFRDKNDLLEYYAKTFSVSKISKSIENVNNVFWIAFIDDLPVGYAKLKKYSKSDFITSDSTSQLQKIYVLADFLALKIGQKIQNEMFEEVKTIGSDNLWLSVLESNERAIKFYKKHDFVEIGKHTFDIGKEHFNFLALKKQF